MTATEMDMGSVGCNGYRVAGEKARQFIKYLKIEIFRSSRFKIYGLLL